jgi:hypothetical protein
MREPYQPRSLKPSSLGTPAALFLSSESPRAFTVPAQGGKTKNERRGKSGALIVQDCDGAEVARAEWDAHGMKTEGEQTIQAGCEGGTSSST